MSSNSFTIVFYMLFPALYLACSNLHESKPEIQAFPSKVVKKGGNVTIRCSSLYYEGRFRLEGGNTTYVDSEHDALQEENFTLKNVQEYNSTNYYCRQNSCGTWSKESDFLTLIVIDPIKPQISYLLDDSENKQLLITCTAPEPPEECRVKRFSLYSGKPQIKDLSAIEGSLNVTFTVSNLTAEYRCSYVLEVKDPPLQLIKSPRSNKTPTIPEDHPDKKGTESTEGDKKETIDTDRDKKETIDTDRDEKTDGINHDILIPVVATVCGSLALILILIIVVHIRRNNKSSPQIMKPSEFPQSGEDDITAEVTYCTVDENRIKATPQVEVDMKDTTMEDYNDGITYAELNKISLKPNTQSYTPTDTSLYAEVKKK